MTADGVVSVDEAQGPGPRHGTIKELVLFFALTLGVMYALCFTVVLYHAPLKAFADRNLGGLDPTLLLYPAAYSPTLVAIGLTAVFGGWAGLKRLFACVFRWRVGLRWWLVAFLTLPALYLVVAVIHHLNSGAPLNLATWYKTLPMLVLSGYIFTDTGGLGEETGWRGFALPRLLERFNPVTAGLIVGFFFGVWHMPAWFLTNLNFNQRDFACFVGSTMVFSVLLSIFYVHMKGSVLLAGIIPHMMSNVCFDAHIVKPDWEYFGYVAILVLILVAVDFRRLFQAAPPFDPQYSPQYYRLTS